MNRGYTKRWRKRWDKSYQKDLLLWVMMDYFIDFATWKDKEFFFTAPRRSPHMVKLKRGECFFTFQGLAKFLTGPKNKVSRKMVRSRTSILEKIGFLGHTQGHDYQIVSVLNYDKYNPVEDEQGHTQEHGRDTVGTQKGHGRDTSNKEKKVKKVNNIKIVLPDFLNIELWAEFKKHRTAIKAPMTPHAEKLCLADLKKLVDAGEDQIDVINQTIKSGKWKSFYPVKSNNRFVEPDIKRASDEYTKRLEKFKSEI